MNGTGSISLELSAQPIQLTSLKSAQQWRDLLFLTNMIEHEPSRQASSGGALPNTSLPQKWIKLYALSRIIYERSVQPSSTTCIQPLSDGTIKRGEGTNLRNKRWLSGALMTFGIPEDKAIIFLKERGFERIHDADSRYLNYPYMTFIKFQRSIDCGYAIASVFVNMKQS